MTNARRDLPTVHPLRLAALILLSLGSIAPGLAQRVLSLDQCTAIALDQNLNMRSANVALRLAKLAREEADRSGRPQVRASAKALVAPYSDKLGYDPAITDGGQYSAQLGVQGLLFDGGARSSRARQLDADVERLGIDERRAARDVRASVAAAFFDLLQVMDESSLQRERIDGLSQYLDLVNRLYHGGGVNYTDVLKTEVSLENARTLLEKEVQAGESAKLSLAEAMGSPDDTAFAIAAPAQPFDSAAAESLLVRGAVDSVRSLDLQSARLNVERSLFSVDIVRSERLPSVSLTGDVGLLSSGDNLKLPSGRRAATVGYSVGITVENLLFDWGSTGLRIEQQQLETENLRLNFELQRRTLNASLERLRGEIRSTMGQMRSIARTQNIAEDNYALTKAQYAGGGTTALDVLSAEQLLADSRLAALQSRADLKRLLSKLEQFYAQ